MAKENKGFTEEEEQKMIELGIKKGVLKENEKAALPHLKYSWKSIVDKYNVWLELKDANKIKL